MPLEGGKRLKHECGVDGKTVEPCNFRALVVSIMERQESPGSMAYRFFFRFPLPTPYKPAILYSEMTPDARTHLEQAKRRLAKGTLEFKKARIA